MRILRLDFGRGLSTLDLHPFVSVVRSIEGLERDELFETVRSVARGSTAGVRGLVQHQGLLVELEGVADDRFLSITGANVVVDCDRVYAIGADGLRAQIDQMRRKAEIDAVIVEEIRADMDPSAAARVASLTETLGPDEKATLAALDNEIATLDRALAATNALPPTVAEAPHEVLGLRARWEEHAARRGAAERHFAALMNAVKQAETRAAKAKQANEIAAAEAKPALLTREEEARLELLSFPEQDESRKGKWRKQLQPDEEAQKNALLAKVGVDSWTAYTVYRATPFARPEKVTAAAEAATALAEAHAGLTEARAALANDQVTTDLNDEADAIRADSRPYLGQLLPSDLGTALAELVVEKPNTEWLTAAAELEQALADLGASVGETPQLTDSERANAIVSAAHTWLERRRRERLDIDFDKVRDDLVIATRSLKRHERALLRIERAELAASGSVRRLLQLQELLESRVDDRDAAVDAALGAVSAVVGQVVGEADGAVPIVVCGRFEAMEEAETVTMMDRIADYAQRLQIIVVSDHPGVASWATEAGLERAGLSSPKAMYRPPSQPTAA